MPYQLYGDLRSGSAIIELVLAELGVPVQLRHVDLSCDRQRDAAYQALNVQRKLPTLISPEGETLTESAAIVMTLLERHREPPLAPPPGTTERAQLLRWLLFVATELYPIIEMKDYPARFQPPGDTISAQRREALEEHYRAIWKDRWGHVECAASGDPWFLPWGFSVLDIYIAVVSRWAQVDPWRRRALPRVEGIAAALARRSRCTSIWARHFG